MATDKAFFVAQSATGAGEALWITDGTASGTRQIQVANADPNGLNPANLAVSASGTLYFEGFDSTGEANLWTSDGTDAGTQELKVAGAPTSGLAPESIVPFGTGVAFASTDNPGLWFSNGTAAGTTATEPANGDSLYAASFTPFAGKLYFAGADSSLGSGLWVTDGTAAGTQDVQVPTASATGFAPTSIASIGSELVLNGIGADDSGARGLWVSDGTAAGTMELRVTGLNPSNSSDGEVKDLFAFGTKAAFVAADASGKEGLWVTDGTAAGTQEVPGVTVGTGQTPMAALSGGKLAFIAADSAGTSGVWVTDGTAAGTQELQPTGAASSLSPNGLVALNGQVLFDGVDASGVRDLWTSDGTSAGTSVLLPGPITLQGGLTSISAETSATTTPLPPPPPSSLTPQQAFVTVLYEGLLGRTPGQAEVQSWTNLMGAGTPETDIAQAFLSSPEYQSISNNQFVTSLYQSFLGRTPGSSEVQGWTAAQANGASQAQVIEGFDDSAEARQRFATQIAGEDPNSAFVTILYQGLLGRAATPAETQGWANALNGGQPEVNVAQGFMSSAEYQSISDSQFVKGLYQSVLGRTAGPAEVQGWTNSLAGGAPRAQVATGFDLSPEASQHWASIIGPTSS